MSIELATIPAVTIAIAIAAGVSAFAVRWFPNKDGSPRQKWFARIMGTTLASINLSSVILIDLYVRESPDKSRASELWYLIVLADLPVSVMWIIVPSVYLVFGVFGSAWWFFLPGAFLPERLGGRFRWKHTPR